VNRIAKWDGSIWSALAGGMSGDVRAFSVFDDGSGAVLIAGGSFTLAGGIPASKIARWDGTTWSGMNSLVNHDVYALAALDDGSGPALFVGGRFTTAGGFAAGRIARWNGTSWTPMGSGMNASVFALSGFDDGGGPALYAGGEFTSAIDSGDSYLARWGTGACSVGTGYCFGDAGCPCGNNGPTGAGCLHSLGAGGTLSAQGRASLSSDTVVLAGSAMPDSSALYFQGTARTNVVFGDGFLCAAGTLVRLATKTNVAGASRYPDTGDSSISVQGGIANPGTRDYQVWYRNAATFCTPSTFNLTNGWEITWGS